MWWISMYFSLSKVARNGLIDRRCAAHGHSLIEAQDLIQLSRARKCSKDGSKSTHCPAAEYSSILTAYQHPRYKSQFI